MAKDCKLTLVYVGSRWSRNSIEEQDNQDHQKKSPFGWMFQTIHFPNTLLWWAYPRCSYWVSISSCADMHCQYWKQGLTANDTHPILIVTKSALSRGRLPSDIASSAQSTPYRCFNYQVLAGSGPISLHLPTHLHPHHTFGSLCCEKCHTCHGKWQWELEGRGGKEYAKFSTWYRSYDLLFIRLSWSP